MALGGRLITTMTNKKLTPSDRLNDIVDAILKHHEDGEDLLDTLLTIATLMNELGSMRFKGAEYNRTFKHGRLSVDVKFKKEK